MKAIIDLGDHVEEMSSIELGVVNGGDGFAHDVGTAIRFGWQYISHGGGTVGFLYAHTDYVINKIKCNC